MTDFREQLVCTRKTVFQEFHDTHFLVFEDRSHELYGSYLQRRNVRLQDVSMDILYLRQVLL